MGGREPQITDLTAQTSQGVTHTRSRGPEVLDLLGTHMREVRGGRGRRWGIQRTTTMGGGPERTGSNEGGPQW